MADFTYLEDKSLLLIKIILCICGVSLPFEIAISILNSSSSYIGHFGAHILSEVCLARHEFSIWTVQKLIGFSKLLW